MSLTYGIDTALWIRLPPDDQAAVKAEFFGQPVPQIGGYADPISVPAPTVATSIPATASPPPTLSSSGAQAFALLNPPKGAKPVVEVVKPIEKATIVPKPEVRAKTLAANEEALGSVQVSIAKSGSAASSITYYTYKSGVPLKPGQTLGFTPGKGYYAAGTPTPVKATTNPPGTSASSTPTPDKTYYTYRENVPLAPGQSLAFAAGKGYYAAGIPTSDGRGVISTSDKVPATPAGTRLRQDTIPSTDAQQSSSTDYGTLSVQAAASGPGPRAQPAPPFVAFPPGDLEPPGGYANPSRGSTRENAENVAVSILEHADPTELPRAAGSRASALSAALRTTGSSSAGRQLPGAGKFARILGAKDPAIQRVGDVAPYVSLIVDYAQALAEGKSANESMAESVGALMGGVVGTEIAVAVCLIPEVGTLACIVAVPLFSGAGGAAGAYLGEGAYRGAVWVSGLFN